VLPREAFEMLASIEGTAQFAITEGAVFIQSADIWARVSTIEGRYPDTNAVLPKDKNELFTINRAALIDATASATRFAESKNQAVIYKTAKGEETLKIAAASSECGEFADELTLDAPAEHSGEIAFNGAYLVELLKGMAADDVTVAQGAVFGYGPALFQGSGENVLRVLMPIKLSDIRAEINQEANQ